MRIFLKACLVRLSRVCERGIAEAKNLLRESPSRELGSGPFLKGAKLLLTYLAVSRNVQLCERHSSGGRCKEEIGFGVAKTRTAQDELETKGTGLHAG